MDLTREQCVSYLKQHNDYAGRSRDNIVRLREAVRLHQEVQAAANTATTSLYASVAGVPTDNPDATADPNPIVRNKLAKKEWEALRAWAIAGRTPPRPATPNLDELEAEHAAAGGKPSRGRRSAAKASKPLPAAGIVFTRNGQPMPPSQNRLSSLAYQCTAKVDGAAPRITTVALVALLAEAGIENPTAGAWSFTLSNGVTIGATIAPAKGSAAAA